jgi:hypothetical protein
MKLKQNICIIPATRLGAIINGSRTRRATTDEKHIVPNKVVVEWVNAADIIAPEDVVGIAWR